MACKDVNVIACVREEQNYIFLYTDENKKEVLRTFARFASNPELNFSWRDATVLSQKVNQIEYMNPENIRIKGRSDIGDIL